MDGRAIMERNDLCKNVIELQFKFIFRDKSNMWGGDNIGVAAQWIIRPSDRFLIKNIDASLARVPIV